MRANGNTRASKSRRAQTNSSRRDPRFNARNINRREFIKSEKNRGKTILLSSHIFSEVDATCDKISIIKDGRLVSSFVADDLRHSESKTYKLEFISKQEYVRFLSDAVTLTSFEVASIKEHHNQVHIHVNDSDVNEFIAAIAEYGLKFFTEIKFTLEDYFMKFYDKNKTFEPSGKNENLPPLDSEINDTSETEASPPEKQVI